MRISYAPITLPPYTTDEIAELSHPKFIRLLESLEGPPWETSCREMPERKRMLLDAELKRLVGA